MNSLLDVRNLSVTYTDVASSRSLVDEVSFALTNANMLAVVGESGSGKTTLCRALTRLFPQASRLEVSGLVQFNKTDLVRCSDETLQHIRKTQIRYIFQEPQQALNPVLTIRKQMEFASEKNTASEIDLVQILHSVGLMNTSEILNSYPHQLSIGMSQRVMLAMAITPKPLLLIADEPTSAIDASLRYQLLDLLKSLQEQERMAIFFVTHDLDVARRYADEVVVLQAGRVIEYATVKEFFEKPQHPYSRTLLDAVPNMRKRVKPSAVRSLGNE